MVRHFPNIFNKQIISTLKYYRVFYVHFDTEEKCMTQTFCSLNSGKILDSLRLKKKNIRQKQ